MSRGVSVGQSAVFILCLLQTLFDVDIGIVLFVHGFTQSSCLGDDCRVNKVRTLVTQYTGIPLTLDVDY